MQSTNKNTQVKKCWTCGKEEQTKYWYSYELTLMLEIPIYQGVYLCNVCREELEKSYINRLRRA